MIECGFFQNARVCRILAVAMKISDLVMFAEVDLVLKIGVDIPKTGVENPLFRNVILCQDKLRASI